MKRDALGAFVPGSDCVITGAAAGPLAGLTFAAKDLFDVAGHVTGSGNPDWAASHPAAQRHAWAVERLLAAGASLIGKTITDEISLGLLGRNRFDGTPVNPAARGRLPGGSSSGSASAVAGGACDLALGTDSGGSVRVPASFCGLYGLRPTHGRIPVAGMATQSPGFDTVGFFARDAETFAKVGSVLLGARPMYTDVEILEVDDALTQCEAEVAAAVRPLLDRIATACTTIGDLDSWFVHQRHLQLGEIAVTFGPWIDTTVPRFSIEVGRTLTLAALVTPAEVAAGSAFRDTVRRRMDQLLEGSRLLCLPTSPILPPPRDLPFSAMTDAVSRIVRLTCIAGLAGLPQVSLPLASAGGVPVGVSLIGWTGSDEVLLGVAQALAPP